MASWLEKMGGGHVGSLDSLPAEVANAEVLVDCSYPVAHAQAHQPSAEYPGRFRCGICHPRPA